MLTVRPRRALGTAIGSVIAVVLLGAAGYLAFIAASQPPSFTSFTAGAAAALLLLLSGCFAYWTYGCWSLSYLLDRNALTIAWAGNAYQVPLRDITGLVPAAQVPPPRSVGGLWWPGYRVGRGRVQAERFPETVLFFAAGQDDRDLTYIVTPLRGYGISPPEPAEFAQELRLRARLGPVEETRQEVRRWLPWDLQAWEDRVVGVLVALGFLANLALFAALALMMPALPDLVPLHLSPLGFIDRVGPKTELFGLPAAGLALLFANTALGAWVYRVERLGAYLIIAWGTGTQALLWGAWLRLLG